MKSCKYAAEIHGVELYLVKAALNFLKRASKNLSCLVPVKKVRKHKMSSISIFITRNNNSKSDDSIKIVPVADNMKMFHVTYLDVELDTNNKTTRYSFTANATGVREYLETTLNLLQKDDMPFKQLQFNLPAYPRIMINLEKLQDTDFMETIWRAIASVCDDWPQRVCDTCENCEPTREPTASHRYFDNY